MRIKNCYLKQPCLKASNLQLSELSQKEKKISKKQNLPFKNKTQKSNSERNHWSKSQEKLYLLFLRAHIKCLKTDNCRKNHIYTKMSRSIESRTNTQCTSHHQKMLRKHGTPQNIIQNLNFLMIKKENKTVLSQQALDVEFEPILQKQVEFVKTPSTTGDDNRQNQIWNNPIFYNKIQQAHDQNQSLKEIKILKQEPQFKQWDQIQHQINKIFNSNEKLFDQ